MPISPGMVVRTDTPKVQAAQRMVVELLWSSGDHNCLTCERNGSCELQDRVYRFQSKSPVSRSPPRDTRRTSPTRYPAGSEQVRPLRPVHRACNEIQVNEVLDFTRRGSRAKVGPHSKPIISTRTASLRRMRGRMPRGGHHARPARFGGRPWETKKVRTTCTYCGVGCQMELNVHEDRIVSVTGNSAFGEPNLGSLCAKGRFGMDFVHHPDRLKKPLIRREKGGDLEEASWEEALDLVASRLKEIMEKSGPDALAGLSSARCTNEENYLFQKFMRAGIGTNNVDHCARL